MKTNKTKQKNFEFSPLKNGFFLIVFQPNLVEILNFYNSKIFGKYNTTNRVLFSNIFLFDNIMEDVCRQMIKQEIAMVSVYFPQGTYTRF
jgi:hypothetical protein